MVLFKKDCFPFPIYIERNPHWFAKIDWFLFTKFGKKRNIPCGQKVNYLYCAQPVDKKHCYISEDKHEIICKCCGTSHLITSSTLDFGDKDWDLKDVWGDNIWEE